MKNVPIIGKFLTIIAVFGAFAIGVAIYATGQMHSIDDRYTALGAHQEAGAIALARANRAFNTAHAAIADLMIATTDADNQITKSRFDAAHKQFEESFDTVMKALPEDGSLPPLRANILQLLDQDCANSIRLGAAATTPAATLQSQAAYLSECSTKFPTPIEAMRLKTDALTDAATKTDEELTAVTNTTIVTTYGVILGGLVLVAGLAFFGVRAWVTTPLGALNAVMGRLAGGDNAVDIAGEDRKDEVGSMARTVQVFKAAAIEKIRLEEQATAQREVARTERMTVEAERAARAKELTQVVDGIAAGLAKLSDGKLAYRLEDAFAAEYETLRRDFNAALQALAETMKVVSTNALAIHSGTGEISTAADDLSRRTEQQAASLEETAAALDQITATVRKTADGAIHAREVVGSAKSDAEKSGAVVREAVQAMSGIEKSSHQIGQIIGVIDEIAFQTNLLALNAGVEAARAGDAGRGFAVVASEVRALAQRSAEAAKEIKALISASGQQVSNGVSLVGEAGRSLERIVTQVTEINGVVGEIAASAQEQATALNQVNTAVNQMDQVTQQNAAMVEETTAASHSLAHEAQELSRLIARFDVGQDSNVEPMRRPTAAPRAPAPRATAPRAAAPRPAMKTVSSGGGGAARKPAPASAPAADDGWEEF